MQDKLSTLTGQLIKKLWIKNYENPPSEFLMKETFLTVLWVFYPRLTDCIILWRIKYTVICKEKLVGNGICRRPDWRLKTSIVSQICSGAHFSREIAQFLQKYPKKDPLVWCSSVVQVKMFNNYRGPFGLNWSFKQIVELFWLPRADWKNFQNRRKFTIIFGSKVSTHKNWTMLHWYQ